MPRKRKVKYPDDLRIHVYRGPPKDNGSPTWEADITVDGKTVCTDKEVWVTKQVLGPSKQGSRYVTYEVTYKKPNSEGKPMGRRKKQPEPEAPKKRGRKPKTKTVEKPDTVRVQFVVSADHRIGDTIAKVQDLADAKVSPVARFLIEMGIDYLLSHKVKERRAIINEYFSKDE